MGSQKTESKVSNPELERTIKDVRGAYQNPDGSWKQSPTIDPTSPESQARSDQLVAPLSADTYAAHQGVRDAIGKWQPGLDQARGYIQDSANPTGQKIDFQGGGWTTGADGRAAFNQNDAYDQSYNQYTDQVVGNTLGRLSDTYDQQRLRDSDAAIKAGSFGGSRQGVQGALTNEMHQRAAAEAAASGYSSAHQSALDQAARLYGQGSQAVGANNALDEANAQRRLAAGGAMSSLEQLAGQFRAGDINAQAGVGSQLEAYEQARRNSVLEESQRQWWEPLQVGQALGGMAAPLNSTTQTQSGGWGSALMGAGLKGLSLLSDKRAKEGIRNADPDKALAELRRLVPQTYSYKKDARALGAPAGERTGFMAQDVEKATGREAPQVGSGFKGVDVAEHIGRLTHALIALDRKVGGKSAAA